MSDDVSGEDARRSGRGGRSKKRICITTDREDQDEFSSHALIVGSENKLRKLGVILLRESGSRSEVGKG